MAKKPDLGAMMGAMGDMPDAGAETTAAADMGAKDDNGEVSDEEMTYAQDLTDAIKSGDATGVGRALKRFVSSCMQSEESGEYQDEEPPASAKAEQGEM